MTSQKRPAPDNARQETPSQDASLAAVRIEVLLNMSEDAVWMLQKTLLRRYFLALQTHLKALTNSITSSTSSTPAVSRPTTTTRPRPRPLDPSRASPSNSRLLSLPPELRRHILLHLLSRPSSTPSRGPHPRSLQSPLSLSRTMPPAILRTCRLLYEEGCAVLYSTQEIHAHVDFDVWAHRRDRSDLVVGPTVRDAVRRLHVHVFLGNEKRLARPGKRESEARLEAVRKGIRKLGKWLLGFDGGMEREGGREVLVGKGKGKEKECRLQVLRISWQEPPQTYTWEQKKTVLDMFRALRPWRAEAGQINWGLKYPGKKFRFVEEYLRQIGQEPGEEDVLDAS